MLAPAPKVQAFLANIPLFRQFDESALERVAAHTRTVRLERGGVVFNAGDEPRGCFWVIVYGQVKLAFRSPRGDEKVVEVYGEGETFGEAMMFVPRPYPVSAQALADTMLLAIGQEAVLPQLQRDPELAARIIAGLCQRIHGLMSDLEAYSMRSSLQRVVDYLLCHCGGADGPAELRLPTTKGVIASRLSITQEHFSRILHDLAGRGLIDVRARVIRIADVRRLRALLD